MVKINAKKHPKLVKFLLKLQGILKTVAIICFSLVLVLGAFFSFRACKKDEMISASADEVSLHSIYGIYIPSTVAFTSVDFVDYYKSTKNYPCSLYMQIGSTIYSTAIIYTKITYDADNDLYMLPVGVMFYYIHSTGEDLFSDIIFDASDQGCLDSSYFRYFYFNIYHNGTFSVSLNFTFTNCTTFDIFRFTSGEVSGEYDEGYNAGYAQGHNAGYNNGYSAGETDGYAQGESDGYENGYTDGSANAEYGFFSDVSVSGTLYDIMTADGAEIDLPFTYSDTLPYISGGMDFKGFLPYLEDLANSQGENEGWNQTQFVLDLKNPVEYNSISLLGTGASSSFWGEFMLYDTNGKSYNCTWERADGDVYWRLVLPTVDGTSSILISKMTMTWGGGSDGVYVSLHQEGVGYYGGYSAGYNEGRDDGYDAGFERGKSIGYENGHSAGFQEGFGQSEGGGFNWLISSVQAFLDFKFFGDFGIGSLLYVGLGMVLVTIFLKFLA